MPFLRQLGRDKNLRLALTRAALIGGFVFLVAEILDNYLASYGWSVKPLMEGKASMRELFRRAWWGTAVGLLEGFAVVYFGYKRKQRANAVLP